MSRTSPGGPRGEAPPPGLPELELGRLQPCATLQNRGESRDGVTGGDRLVHFTWYRSSGWFYAQSGSALLATLSAGQTLTRTRFNANVVAYGDGLVEALTLQGEGCHIGLVTTIGDGTEAVPSALEDLADADPPAERWLWWEARYLHMTVYTGGDQQLPLHSNGPAEPTDSRAQVLAPTMPAGDSLHLHFAFSVTGTWPVGFTYDPYVQWWASVLVRTP